MKRLRAILCSPALALSLAALFWSGNFIAGRALRDDVDPLTLNFARWLIALVLLAPAVWRSMVSHFDAVRREWRLIVAMGATGIAAFHTLVYLALQTATATNALLTLCLAPMAIIAGAAAVSKERPSGHQLIGVLISIAGASLLITRGDLAVVRGAAFEAGDLWMLVAILVWAAYSLLLRRCPSDLPQSVALTASIVVALLLLAPFLPLAAGPRLTSLTSVAVLLSIGYIAVFASVVAFLLWSYGVSRLGPSRSGQFIQLMPVFGTVLAVAVLNEIPTFAQIAGATLVLSGIVIVKRRQTIAPAPIEAIPFCERAPVR